MSPNHEPSKIDMEIDTALKMLGEVRPPVEMELRIRQRLMNAADLVRGRNRQVRLFWIPTTCAVAAAVLLMLFLPSHGLLEQQAPATENAKIGIAQPAPALSASTQSEIVTRKNNEARVVSKAVRISHRQQHPEYRHAKNLLNYPLTEQEKLLVQFAQTAKPEDLRYLNPEYQAKVDARQKAKFAAYLKSHDISSGRETAD